MRQLAEMRRSDGQARALYRLLTMPVRAALREMSVQPVKGGDEEAEFVHDMLTVPPYSGGMTTPLNRVVAEMLTGTFDGFSVHELVPVRPTFGPLKGRYAIGKLARRPPETLAFHTDAAGEVTGVRQRTVDARGRFRDVTIPGGRLIRYTANAEESPYFGVSYFNAAFYHYDKKCFVGDTKVSLLDGTEVEIREVARRSAAGEDIWVYSYVDGRVVPGRVSHAWRVGQRETVRVRLDNDEIVRCTPDHRFMLRDGSYRQAQDLRSGDSLMPLYRRDRTLGKTGYEQVQHPGDSTWRFTHSVVARETRREYKWPDVAHHRDINPRNNRPDNLQVMDRKAHIELHGNLMRERWRDQGFRERVLTPETSAKRAEGLRRAWATKSPAARAEWVRNRTVAAYDAGHYRDDVTIEVIADQVRAGVARRVEVAEALGTSDVIVLQRVRDAGFSGWREFVVGQGADPVEGNVGRPQRFTIADVELAYSAAADERGFATASAVKDQLGCSFIQLYRTVKYHGYATFAEWRDGEVSPQNHKVAAVEQGEVEDVYDMEVPELENFALTAGVFVHNCKLYYLAHLAAQHQAVGSRHGKHPPNATDAQKREFRRALADFGLAQVLTTPSGQDWDVEELGRNLSQFPFMDYINHHSSQMSKSVLAPFFDNQQGGQQALVDFGGQTDSLFMILESVLISEIESVLTDQVVPRFVDWNFGTGNYPQVKFGPFSDEQKKAVQSTFDKLAVAGQTANVTRPFLLEIERRMASEMGLEIDYEPYEEALDVAEDAVLDRVKQSAEMGPVPPFTAGSRPIDRSAEAAPRPEPGRDGGESGGGGPSGPGSSGGGQEDGGRSPSGSSPSDTRGPQDRQNRARGGGEVRASHASSGDAWGPVGDQWGLLDLLEPGEPTLEMSATADEVAAAVGREVADADVGPVTVDLLLAAEKLGAGG